MQKASGKLTIASSSLQQNIQHNPKMLDPVEVSVRRAFASKHTHLMKVNTAFLLGIYLDSEAIRLEYEANI